jgi:hypothetical protein
MSRETTPAMALCTRLMWAALTKAQAESSAVAIDEMAVWLV